MWSSRPARHARCVGGRERAASVPLPSVPAPYASARVRVILGIRVRLGCRFVLRTGVASLADPPVRMWVYWCTFTTSETSLDSGRGSLCSGAAVALVSGVGWLLPRYGVVVGGWCDRHDALPGVLFPRLRGALLGGLVFLKSSSVLSASFVLCGYLVWSCGSAPPSLAADSVRQTSL